MRGNDKLVDRQTLYDEVWAEPVSIVARRYGISDVGLAKICRKLRVPLPGRGYWAKAKAGKILPRTQLPQVGDGKLPYVTLRRLEPAQRQLRSEAQQKADEAKKAVVVVPSELVDAHPLVRAAAKRLKRRDRWTDEKGLRSAPAEVLHIEVTRGALDRALLIVDTLIKQLAGQSISVHVDAQRKDTQVDVEGTRLELRITEGIRRTPHVETRAEKRARECYWSSTRFGPSVSYPHIPQFDYHPTGILTIIVGRWPSRNWNDTPKSPLEKRLGEVIAGIVSMVSEKCAREAEEARRREARRKAEERYQIYKQRLESEKTKFSQLEAEAASWERAERIRAYANAVEHRQAFEGSVPSHDGGWIA